MISRELLKEAKAGLLYEKSILSTSYHEQPTGDYDLDRAVQGELDCWKRISVENQLIRKKIILTNWIYPYLPLYSWQGVWPPLLQQGFELYIWNGAHLVSIRSDIELECALYTIRPISQNDILTIAAAQGLSADEVIVCDYFNSKEISAILNDEPVIHSRCLDLDDFQDVDPTTFSVFLNTLDSSSVMTVKFSSNYHYLQDYAKKICLRCPGISKIILKYDSWNDITTVTHFFKTVKETLKSVSVISCEQFDFVNNILLKLQASDLLPCRTISFETSNGTLDDIIAFQAFHPNLIILVNDIPISLAKNNMLRKATPISPAPYYEHKGQPWEQLHNLQMTSYNFEQIKKSDMVIFYECCFHVLNSVSIPYLPNLRTAIFTHCILSSKDLCAFLNACPQLETLELRGELEELANRNHWHLKHGKNIKQLSISAFKKIEFPYEHILFYCNNLTTLKLENIILKNSIYTHSMRCANDHNWTIFPANAFPNLKKLSLIDCSIDTEQFFAFWSEVAPHLEILDFNNNTFNISAFRPTIFKQLKSFEWDYIYLYANEAILKFPPHLLSMLPPTLLSLKIASDESSPKLLFYLQRFSSLKVLKLALPKTSIIDAIKQKLPWAYFLYRSPKPSPAAPSTAPNNQLASGSHATNEPQTLFKPSQQLFLDNKLASDPNETRVVRKIFIAKNPELEIPNYYRYQVLDKLVIDENQIQIRSSEKKTIPYHCPVIPDLKKHFDAQTDPDLAYTEINVLIDNNPLELPGLSPNDELVAITLDLTRTWIPEEKRYFIAQVDSTPTMITVGYVLRAKRQFLNEKPFVIKKIRQWWFSYKEVLPPKNFFSAATFSLINGKLKLNCRFSDDHFQNLFNQQLKQYQSHPFEAMQAIAYFCRQFAEGKEDVPEEGVQLLNRLLRELKGVCRHRVILFMAIAEQFSIPARVIINEIHTYLDVLSQAWKSLCLGGGSAQIVHANSSPIESKESKLTRKISEEEKEVADFLKEPAKASPTEVKEAKKPLALSHFSSDHPLDIITELLTTKLAMLPANKRQAILVFSTQEEILAFNSYLLQYAAKHNRRHIYLDHFKNLKETSSVVNESGQIIHEESPIFSAFRCSQEHDTILIRYSEFKPEYVGFNTLFDKNRRFKHLAIQPGVCLLVAVLASDLKKFREDFYSRIGRKNIYVVPNQFLLTKPPETKVTEHTYFINLYESMDWKKLLLGRYKNQAGKIKFKPGALIKRLNDETFSGQICLLNPPKEHSFNVFWSELQASRKVHINGKTWHLKPTVSLTTQEQEYKLDTSFFKVEHLNADNENLWTHTLNTLNYTKYFKIHTSDQNHQPIETPGWIRAHANRGMTLLMTQPLSISQRAYLTAKAIKHNCPLYAIIAPGVQLPGQLDSQFQPTQVSQKSLDKMPPYNKNNMIIVTPDPQFTRELIQSEMKIDQVFSISNEMGYELIEKWHIRRDSASGISPEYSLQPGPVLTLLQQGKTVLLKGNLSSALARGIESFFKSQVDMPGQLIIVTPTADYFTFSPYYYVHSIDANHYWSELSDEFPLESCQHLQVLLLKHEIQPSSIQSLRTMLTLLQDYPDQNPLDAWLLLNKSITTTELPEYKNEDELLEKLKAIESGLNRGPYVFLMGPSGAGKSTIINEHLYHYYQEKNIPVRLCRGIESLSHWSNPLHANELAILFLDEANLSTDDTYEMFEGLFENPPVLLHRGQSYDLSSQHKIIFAGNYSHFQNRTIHPLFLRHGHIQHFTEFSPEYIAKMKLIPMMKEICPELKENIDDLTTVFVNNYRYVRSLPLIKIMTQRNLEEMTKIFIALWIQHSASLPSFLLAKWAAYNASQDYLFPDEKTSFCNQLFTEDEFKRCQFPLPEFKSTDFVLTSVHERSIVLLQQQWYLRNLDKQYPYWASSGLKGSLSEGPSGIGKSSIIIIMLTQLFGMKEKDLSDPSPALENEFYYLTPTDPEQMKKILYKAYHEGAIVVVDELNTLPLEEMLNILFSTRPTKPGFRLFTTQNSLDFNGRLTLSPAFENRFHFLKLNQYTFDQLVAIITYKCKVSSLVAQQAVREFEKQQATALVPPVLRDLIDEMMVTSSYLITDMPGLFNQKKKNDFTHLTPVYTKCMLPAYEFF